VKGCVADYTLASHCEQLLPACRNRLGAHHLYRKGRTWSGDMRAADILLRRLWPERKGRPVQMDLPAIMAPSDLAAALGAVAGAVAAGELSPEEGAAVASILEAQRRAVETVEMEARIAALEQNRGANARN
jgi:hypothetical protein